MFFPNRPESPLVEMYRFSTDILLHKDGTEQRICLRVAPRQEFNFQVMCTDGIERQRMENFLYSQMAEEHLIPVWTDSTYLSSAAAAAATSISCDTTLSDFRVGGKAVIFQDEDNYEIIEDLTVTDSSLGFDAGLANLWPANTEILPLRTARITDQVRSTRWASSLTRYSMNWRVTENDVNLNDGVHIYDALGFGTDSTRLVVDDANAMGGTLNEGHERSIIVFDGGTGVFGVISEWLHTRRSSVKGWVSNDRAKLWGVRKFLHYLQGMQGSFILPTFAGDVTAKENIATAASTLLVANAGFTAYTALGQKPRKYIRVTKTDGTRIGAVVTNITVVDPTTEQITIAATWGADIALEDIERISILEKVRLDSDEITITHTDLKGSAELSVAVKAVLE